ncbi:MAG: alpha-L-rhamnosidase [Clostridia bacterium]|nr:alpha-L-rhamnosidase [Clostridia bacterium]
MNKVYDKFPRLAGKDPDTRARRYVTPTRILWTSREDGAQISGEESLLLPRAEQISFGKMPFCHLSNRPGQPKASILLDYGIELHGTVRLLIKSVDSPTKNCVNIRIRFGESAMEAMTDLGVKNTTNDHANRDMVMSVGFLSAPETNESGFRFVRIDLLDDEADIWFKSINATFIFRDLDYVGSFDCSDPQLTKIWDTAAYTAHLNMQEYLWDGIKRDRLVWIGDMHTEIMTILSVFGANEVIPKSLDLARDDAPIVGDDITWMNDTPAYSLWWILNQYEWYKGVGDQAYLAEQKEYMTKLLCHLVTLVDENGAEQLPGKFLDWPNNANNEAKHAGMQGLLKMALERGAEMIEILADPALAAECRAAAERMNAHCPVDGGSKSAGALLVLAGLKDAAEENRDRIAVNGAHGFSTFLGYYILQAKVMAGDWQGALDAIREYWGGMLKMGATSFWEDFNLEWMENAAPIDELVPEGKVDIHGDWGAYCYVMFRHSLCHGWASGPCPFMTHYVLGIQVAEPGCGKIRIAPHLGDLTYAKGTFPTPYGVLSVSHVKNADGTVTTEIDAPEGVEIV